MALLQHMGDAHARLLLLAAAERDPSTRVEAIVALHAASMEAIERVLGAPPNALYRADADAVLAWVVALQPARLG